MTARTRRRWQPEERLAVIKEVQEKGSVVQTCRKYSIDPAMYYRWKASYDTFGVDGLKSHYRRMEHGLRKLMQEDSRLKKLLAAKDLGVLMLSGAYKKRSGGFDESGQRLCSRTHSKGFPHLQQCEDTLIDILHGTKRVNQRLDWRAKKGGRTINSLSGKLFQNIRVYSSTSVELSIMVEKSQSMKWERPFGEPAE